MNDERVYVVVASFTAVARSEEEAIDIARQEFSGYIHAMVVACGDKLSNETFPPRFYTPRKK